MRAVEKKETRGSLKWIRYSVNEHVESFNEKVRIICNLGLDAKIEWVSPLASDDYAEYGDQAFLDRLGITLPRRKLTEFWPNRGPQWDALGRTNYGHFLLVEAKANVPEIVSPGTGASKKNRNLIENSLTETKEFLGVDTTIPWSGKLYQYANRLAHLYLLRQLNRIPAYLVFVYFVGDMDVKGPETVAEWKAAISVAKGVLGVGVRNPLDKYIREVFVDVREFKDTV